MKLADLRKEFEPKFKEAREKMESILTAEQKKARDEAFKAALAAGKKGKEFREAVESAMKLTGRAEGQDGRVAEADGRPLQGDAG